LIYPEKFKYFRRKKESELDLSFCIS